jgi:nucleoside phosphorylase
MSAATPVLSARPLHRRTTAENSPQNEILTETSRRQKQVLDRLQKALNDKNLVIIVGAGVTLSATADASGKPLPRTTWTGLVRNGLDYILEGDYLDASNRRIRRAYEALEDNDKAGLLDAANIMKDLLVQLRQYPTWLESVFGSLHQDVRHPAIFDVLKALHEKGAILLTTNYDDLLERFCNLRRIGRSNMDDILKFKCGDLDGVFHVHGSYQDPNEVVLDSVNYYQVMQSDEVQNILKTFLEFKTVLFVGCGSGLEDPNFDALLRWASERQKNISNRHCLLIRNGDTLNYSPLIRLKYGPDYQDLAPYLNTLLGDTSQPASGAGNAPTSVSWEYSDITERSVASIAHLPKRPEREPLRFDFAGMNQLNSGTRLGNQTNLASSETSIPKEPARQALTHHDYTVGWICALAIEMAAAVGMLDKRHDSLPQDSRDHNNYVLGQIGPHNVAIACLPAGVPGVTPAARVASHMLSTFTSLRFGLMVGIGGGVPSQDNDIRLGDVVVSQPTKSFGGVIQYDFGKTVQVGKLERTGMLNRPPDVLLRAVASLQARHMMEEPALSRYLSEMGSKYPRLASASTFPGTEHDRLFKAAYDHPATEVTCANCQSDQLITRTERGDNIPAIHYGLIASGNQLMRDGKTRERLRSELQILCFETEAAGLMDDFPCLVIRGICDYADSHESKQWQPYAAATAAAYAKELLNIISATQVVQTTAIHGGE